MVAVNHNYCLCTKLKEARWQGMISNQKGSSVSEHNYLALRQEIDVLGYSNRILLQYILYQHSIQVHIYYYRCILKDLCYILLKCPNQYSYTLPRLLCTTTIN